MPRPGPPSVRWQPVESGGGPGRGAAGPALALAPRRAGPGGLEGRRGFVLRDVVATAFLRPRLVLLALLVPLLAGIVAGVLTPDRYTAEALMIVAISRESAGNTDIGGYGPAILSIDAPKAVQSEIEIVTSDAVARDALARVGPQTLYPAVAGGGCSACCRRCRRPNGWRGRASCCAATLRADVLPNTNTVRVQFDYPDRAVAIRTLAR